jgi:phosphatidate cytidylyltransferase
MGRRNVRFQHRSNGDQARRASLSEVSDDDELSSSGHVGNHTKSDSTQEEASSVKQLSFGSQLGRESTPN